MLNREAFYNSIRQTVFKTGLSQSQVEGIDAILDEWDARGLTNNDWLAYMLATVAHETGMKMQPVEENLNYSAERLRQVFPKYFTAAQAKKAARNPEMIANLAYGGRMGNTKPGYGYLYRGRGLPQITGFTNYKKATDKTGIDLVNDPDKALELPVAVTLLFDGMIDGWYTGLALEDFFNTNESDPKNARKIINGLDQAQKVANLFQNFRGALNATTIQAIMTRPMAEPNIRPRAEVTSSTGMSSDAISTIQQLLRDKGFPEVGNVDGKAASLLPGSRTMSAIAAAQAYYGWPAGLVINQDFIGKLALAPKRVISEERATATKEEVKPVSKVLRRTSVAKKFSNWLTGGGLGIGMLSSAVSGDANDVGQKLDLFERISQFVTTNWWIVIPLAGLAFTYLYLNKAEDAEVEAYQEGQKL